MPTTVNIVNGHASAPLKPGDSFVWVNPTGNPVQLTNCSGFCTQGSYNVPAAGPTPGQTPAQINSAPNGWTFSENPSNTWNPGGPTPGNPRIQNPTRFHEHAKDEHEHKKNVA